MLRQSAVFTCSICGKFYTDEETATQTCGKKGLALPKHKIGDMVSYQKITSGDDWGPTYSPSNGIIIGVDLYFSEGLINNGEFSVPHSSFRFPQHDYFDSRFYYVIEDNNEQIKVEKWQVDGEKDGQIVHSLDEYLKTLKEMFPNRLPLNLIEDMRRMCAK